MKNVAIITARGGSKRIPRKNIKIFLGKPIISYAIEAAKDSGLFNEVMVSTDDFEIAEVARRYGADVPFFRSKTTSDDFATTADVVFEVLNEYVDRGFIYEQACCIYPTAAFVTGSKLKAAWELMEQKKFDTVLPIVQFNNSIYRSLVMDTNEKIFFNYPEYKQARSQDLPRSFYDSGQFYWLQVEKFLRTKKIYTDNTGGIEIDELDCQDIDTENDWKLAELKYKLMNGNEA